MSFNTALTAGQYAKLRSASHASDYLVTFCANTVLLTGTVQSDLTTPSTWLQFNYTATAGTYTNVEADMVLLIGKTNDKTKATYRGRVRSISSTIIYCSESSQDFNVGDYFWVLYTFDPQYKLSKPDANGNELIDGTLTYAGPEPMVRGLRTSYCDYVDSSTGKMRVAFNVATSYATMLSGSIAGYQFTFKAGTYTVVSGSLSSNTVTIDFNPGESWGKLVITDSDGTTKTRRFYIKAHDANNPPDVGFENLQLTDDLNRGWTLTLPAFAGVDNVLRDTFCTVWRANEVYGGTVGALDTTNNIAFVGWFQRENTEAKSDNQYSVLEDASFEITGIGARMARLTAQLIAMRINANPSVWGELANLTPWRAICHFLSRYTTIANLCDVDFSDQTNTFLFPAINTQGGNVYNAISGIAGLINALVEFAPDGRIGINRSAEYLDQTARNALTLVANWTTQDCLSASLSLEQNRSIGKVDGDGAAYNTANGQIIYRSVRAPGHAQGEAQGSNPLPSQILAVTSDATAALAELKQRVGNKYDADNNSEVLSAEFPSGYEPVLIASKAQLHTFTLSALSVNGVDRINYTTATYWMLESVTIGRPGNGVSTVRGQFRKLPPIGDPGDDTTLTPETVADDPLPDLGMEAYPFEDTDVYFPEAGLDLNAVNPAQLQPPAGQVLDKKGGTVIASDGTWVSLLKNFVALKVPKAFSVVPSDLGSYAVKAVLFDPFGTRTAQGCYLLASDGNNSAVWWTPNVALPSPVWTKGADVAGVYTVLRAGNVAGAILMEAPGAGDAPLTYDFTVSDGGWSAADGYPNVVWVAGLGWHSTDPTAPDQVFIKKTWSSTYVTTISLTISNPIAPNPPYSLDNSFFICPNDTGVGCAYSCHNTLATSCSKTVNANATSVSLGAERGGPDQTAWGYVTGATINASSGSAVVAYSNDYGATFASPVTVGTTPGTVGGLDTQKAGAVSYAACAAKVRKATTLGGAYSDHTAYTGANPVCVIIPWYRWTSTTSLNTNVSDPDYLVALDTADSDGGTLYRVNGTTAVKTDITPTAGITFDSANCATMYYGKYLAVIGKVGGVYKLYKSANSGTSWTFVKNLTAPHFIRGRRGDNSILRGKGQLYVTHGDSIDYSGYFGTNGTFPRTMPNTGVLMFDILG